VHGKLQEDVEQSEFVFYSVLTNMSWLILEIKEPLNYAINYTRRDPQSL